MELRPDLFYRNALKAIDPQTEELHKIFFYDSAPFEGRTVNPLNKQQIDFAAMGAFTARKRFNHEMARKDLVALRLGFAKPRGWILTRDFTKLAIKGGTAAPTATDVQYSLEQKGVDMRIGIDVATLAIKKQVERIILISGDADMIPAMKLARREGVQVVLIEMDGRRLTDALVEDADLVRKLVPTAV